MVADSVMMSLEHYSIEWLLHRTVTPCKQCAPYRLLEECSGRLSDDVIRTLLHRMVTPCRMQRAPYTCRLLEVWVVWWQTQ